MTSFSREYEKRLADIEKRALAAGSNMTEVCRNTKIARATFERGRIRPPQSITKIDVLENEVARIERSVGISKSRGKVTASADDAK